MSTKRSRKNGFVFAFGKHLQSTDYRTRFRLKYDCKYGNIPQLILKRVKAPGTEVLPARLHQPATADCLGGFRAIHTRRLFSVDVPL